MTKDKAPQHSRRHNNEIAGARWNAEIFSTDRLYLLRYSSVTMAPINKSLELSKEEMRDLGHKVVDMLVEHFASLGEQPPARTPETREALEKLLREPLPHNQGNIGAALAQLREQVFPHMLHVTHPRFFAFVPSPNNFVSVLADALASGFNPFLGTWLGASGPAQLELVTLDWLKDLCGLPATMGGLFVSGGSMANLTALAVARHVKLGEDFSRGIVYYSDQTHSSNERALRTLGFRQDQLRKLPSDMGYRLSLAALQENIADDRANGLKPFCIAANAGATNTGAVDPLVELAALCEREGLWLHADGAYGAAAAITSRGRDLLVGLEGVDSLSLDPHKWLFQPYELGCVLLKSPRLLRDTFHIMPEYLKDTAVGESEVNFSEHGLQLTRNFRALKLWLSLKAFGADAFREAVAYGFELAEQVEELVRNQAHWEVVTPAQMGIINFRYVHPSLNEDELNALNKRIIECLVQDGFAMISSTVLRGKSVIRMCTINPRTTREDLEQTVRRLEEMASRV